jgi:hypothetical protein
MKRVLPFLLLAATSPIMVLCLQKQALMHHSPRISIGAYVPEGAFNQDFFSKAE